MPPKDNQYLPKYIQNVPWYYKDTGKSDDTLYHHRRDINQQPVDLSLPQAGTGIHDDYETVNGVNIRKEGDFAAKRDRWHGYSSAEWDEVLAKWDIIKKKQRPLNENDDSDDTDYELEIQELGLNRKDLRTNLKEDAMEKAIRDRRDVPLYILAINANEGGKIRLGKDSTASLVNDDSVFVKPISGEEKELRQMQHFAWEQNKEYEDKKLRELYEAQLAGMSDPYAVVESSVPVDLDLNIEASPTLMMLRNRQNEEKKRKAVEEKKRGLLSKYGPAS